MTAMLSAALLSLALGPAGPCDLELRGRIVDGTTGEGVARVDVRAADGEPSTQTDATGAYVLPTLCPGPQTIEVSRADYQPATVRLKLPSDRSGDVSLEPYEAQVLDDVVVVAPAPKSLDTSATDSLDAEALDKLRGRGLADSLASLSGVRVLRGPAGGMGKPIIRGQVGRRNLILYDRVRHESQKWGLEHAPEIDPFAADSITVIKGAGGIRYGPDAIGGVVLIDPPPLPVDPGVSGEAHLVGVSNGLRGSTALRLQGAHRVLPGFAWRVEGNVTRGGAAVTPDYPLDNTGSRTWNVGGTLGYQRAGFSLQGTYRRHEQKAGVFTGLRTENVEQFEDGLGLDRPLGADLYRRDYDIERAFQQVTHDLGIVRGRAPLGRAGALIATYALQVNDRDEFDVVRQSVRGPQLEFDLRTHSADLVFEQTPVSVGERVVLEGSVGASFADRRNRFDGSDPAFLPDYDERAGGVFVVERLAWERVELEAGARYDGMRRDSALDDRTFLPFRAQDRLPDDCTETEEGADCTTSFHAASGSAGVAVRPLRNHPELVAKLDATTAVRFPNTDEQFIKGSAPSFPVFSNGLGTLGLERTWGGGLTLGYATPWLSAEAAGYANFIDDYIYFRGEPQSRDPDDPNFSDCAPLQCGVQGAFPLFAPVPVDSLFYGGELQGEVQPPRWPVSIRAQASWVRAQQVANGEPLVFIPPDRYRLGVTYHWPDLGITRNGHVGVGGTFVDRQRRFDREADFTTPPPAYGLLEAEAGLDVPLGAQVLKLAVSGANLTNARYRDYTSLLRYFANEPGWELMLRVTLVFGSPAG